MHIHTNSSDGILTPTEVVEWSKKLGLQGIAITDHDTVDGIEEGLKTASKYDDFIVIPGIEFSTLYKEKEIHILGYFFDYKNRDLLNMTEKIKAHRNNRARLMIELLKNLGIDIKIEEVIQDHEESSIGRPHIARILVSKGYAHSIQEAFDKYLNKGKPAYVGRYKLSLEESVKIIDSASGIPVLAHPGLIDKTIDIHEICNLGIKGMEVYHTQHSLEDTRIFLSMAKEMKLIITGGSDYHDMFINGTPAIGSVTIPFETIRYYYQK